MAEQVPSQDGRLLRGHRGVISPDGRHVVISFLRADNSEHEFIVPFDTLADLVILMEATSKQAIERQRATFRSQASYHVKARRLTKLSGAVSNDGVPVLTIEINGQLQLDLALPLELIPQLQGWLTSLTQTARSHPAAGGA